MNEEYLNREINPLKWWLERRTTYPHVYNYVIKFVCTQKSAHSSELKSPTLIKSNTESSQLHRDWLVKPALLNNCCFGTLPCEMGRNFY